MMKRGEVARRCFSAGISADGIVLGCGREVLSEWLWDNKEEHVNKTTMQRVAAPSFERYVKPLIDESRSTVKANSVEVKWRHCDETNVYTKEWLLQERLAARRHTTMPVREELPSFDPRKKLWDKNTLGELPTLVYSGVMSGRDTREWLELIGKYGFCLLKETPVEAPLEAVKEVAKVTANYPRASVFGDVWRFEAGYAHADTAYTDEALAPHADGCYSFDPPGLQMLHCVEYAATGGLSTLLDGFHALSVLKEEDPAAFRVLLNTLVSFSYADNEKGILLKNTTPIIATDPLTNTVLQIRYNDGDRDPFPYDTPASVYKAWAALSRLVHRASAQATFQLLPGTTLVFDNWRTLHGRTAFTGQRRCVGCYLNMEDYLSRARILRCSGM